MNRMQKELEPLSNRFKKWFDSRGHRLLTLRGLSRIDLLVIKAIWRDGYQEGLKDGVKFLQQRKLEERRLANKLKAQQQQTEEAQRLVATVQERPL